MTIKKKLIEVALPLDAINVASAREKSIRHGHPSTLHLWWARRPLAAARAVIFAQMVDDPSAHPDIFPTEKAQEKERQRLFRIIEDLVKWESTTNEEVLQRARDEIWQSWRYTCAENADHPRAKELFDRQNLPTFHDPFAGGGALPLEAQRLGLESYASDLNPVAVLINKAMIEIPHKFADRRPINPETRQDNPMFKREWTGTTGLAEDIRYYGRWMRDEAVKRIGYLYPSAEITPEIVTDRPELRRYLGRKLTVLAWIWARTVKSPNPAFANVAVPLATSFMLASKPGKEAFIEPVIENGGYSFAVRLGKPTNPEAVTKGTKSGSSGSSFLCLMSGTPIPFDYIRAEAKSGRMGARLMALVVKGDNERIYLSPTLEMETTAASANPGDAPESALPPKALGFRVQEYGMTHWRDLFTPRQLIAMVTLSDLVLEAREKVRRDAESSGQFTDETTPNARGEGAIAYADAVAIYLALSASKAADNNSTICSWMPGVKYEVVRNTFSRHAIPMTWDYAESNPFGESSGDFYEQVKRALLAIDISFSTLRAGGRSVQADAQSDKHPIDCVVSTDPPYYDNIGYADLSDFFYVWLRRSLRIVVPELFATVAVPKAEELVATQYRHGSKEKADSFFLDGMTKAMHQLTVNTHPTFPVTIYYAFKQSESESIGNTGTISTGWDTFLEAVIRAGFMITGTWPIRTERGARSIGIGTNALASSIVLVCRPKNASATAVSRREFVTALRAELPLALAHLQRGNIAPVDLAQAAIGPGMSVFTRYSGVLDAAGRPLSVRDALSLINQTLDEALAEQEGDFDADTRWALTWFDQTGFTEGEYGVAEQLSKSKNTSVTGMVNAGILESKRGKVRLLKPNDLSSAWNPATDPRLTTWEMVHQLIRALDVGGESAAAEIVAKVGPKAETARELAYRLYTISERKKRASEALSYNGLVQSWPEITRLARENAAPSIAQGALFGSPEE